MRASVFVSLISSCSLALGQGPVTEPSDFEAYVSAPSVTVRSSRHVGKIESSDALLDVVALVAEDTARSTSEMRGARFDFQNNTGQDHVYLDETELSAIKQELTWIEKGIPRLEDGPLTQWRVQGTGACWMPPRPVRILCPSYKVGPDGHGLTLGAYGGPVYAFPEHRPSELHALIDLALAALEER